MLILEEPIVVIHSKKVAELAARYRIPTMFSPVAADAGGLIAYDACVVNGVLGIAMPKVILDQAQVVAAVSSPRRPRVPGCRQYMRTCCGAPAATRQVQDLWPGALAANLIVLRC
jgi:hypothetical protein